MQKNYTQLLKMGKRTVEIVEENRVYNGYTKVDEATIKDVLEDGSESVYKRQKVVRPDAVACLIYNIDTESVVLIRQHRYPTQTKNKNGFIYEVPAGKIDPGEDPMVAMMRECFEEVGYKIKEEKIELCFSCYASPGYSTEKIYYFLATVTNKDKVRNAGGGLESEHENIEIHELHYLQFKSMMPTLEDAKTKMLAYEAHYKNLFDRVK